MPINIALLYSKWHLLNFLTLDLTGSVFVFIHNYSDEDSKIRLNEIDIIKIKEKCPDARVLYTNINRPFYLLYELYRFNFLALKKINLISAGGINYALNFFIKPFNQVTNTVIDEGTSSYYSNLEKGIPSKLNPWSKLFAPLKKLIHISYTDRRFFYFNQGNIHVNKIVKKDLSNILEEFSETKSKNIDYQNYDLLILDNMKEIFLNRKERAMFLEQLLKSIKNDNLIVKFHPSDIFNLKLNRHYESFENSLSSEDILYHYKFKNVHSGISTAGLNGLYLFDLDIKFFYRSYLRFGIHGFYSNRIKNFNDMFFNE